MTPMRSPRHTSRRGAWPTRTWCRAGSSMIRASNLHASMVGVANWSTTIGPTGGTRTIRCSAASSPDEWSASVTSVPRSMKEPTVRYGFYVHPDAWGTGLADALIERCHAALADRFDDALLWVLTDNPRARRFYERNGWSCGLGDELIEDVWPGPSMPGRPPFEAPLAETRYRRPLPRAPTVTAALTSESSRERSGGWSTPSRCHRWSCAVGGTR